MPVLVFGVTVFYLLALIIVFVVYSCSPSFRRSVPANLGPLPIGVVWFGPTGAVLASLRGTYIHNENWNASYNYWYFSRPLFGVIAGPIGALFYWVLLRLGNTGHISVDRTTFYAVAFVLGFADKAFMEMLENITEVIIKPGRKSTQPPA